MRVRIGQVNGVRLGIIVVVELFEKCYIGSKVGKWSGGLPLSGIRVLAMIPRIVKSRFLFSSSLISAICQINCAINLFLFVNDRVIHSNFIQISIHNIFNHFFFVF